MGNSVSSQTPAAQPKTVAKTTLWGSWDKPVAQAYTHKQQQISSAQSSPEDAAGKSAAGAALDSSVQLHAGAGLNPVVVAHNPTAKSGKAVICTGLKSHNFQLHQGLHDICFSV